MLRTLTLVAATTALCACGTTDELHNDIGTQEDGGVQDMDAVPIDMGTIADAGAGADTGGPGDTGVPGDSGGTVDMGGPADMGSRPPTQRPPARQRGPVQQVPSVCMAPPLLNLDDIPDDPSLDDSNPDTTAIFEVVGNQLVGKFVRDRFDAEGGLRLWQEVVLRIPSNQLLDLVQFNIYERTDPAAYFNRNGNVQTDSFGLKIGFSTRNFTLNQPDICAPLEPRRGTFDWSLVHEFGHLRGWVDGSWPLFLTTFEDRQGPGTGYPADGSPVLTGEFVTDYAERADGDEDHAESWTTFVMLPESAIPAETPGEPLALAKVRWMRTQPDLVELRQAIRITEPGGGGVTVQPAPRLLNTLGSPQIMIPVAMHGTWQGEVPMDGAGRPAYDMQFTLSPDDVVAVRFEAGVEVERTSLQARIADGSLIGFEDQSASVQADTVFAYVADLWPRAILGESFSLDGEILRWSRDYGPQDVELRRVP